jgi:tRNA (guanine37-N1)-methyltransferase
MINFHVLTLFPSIFNDFTSNSIPAIAMEKGKTAINIIDFREFSVEKSKSVDDYQYGGGAGMVIKPEPLSAAIESITNWHSMPIIYFTPQGDLLNQKIVRSFLSETEMIIICGHYKEIDQRIRDKYVTHEISIGDYILSGGELPALVFMDAIIRLLDGVLNDLDSALSDSHENGILGYPCYTRPYNWNGMLVPEVLCSGHHENISKWRAEKSLELTKKKRPDLL